MQRLFRKAMGLGILGMSFFIFTGMSLKDCYDPTGPTPKATVAPAPLAWTEQQVDDLVVMDQQSIYSAAPRTNGVPPPECDYIKFLRFRLKNSSAGTDDKDAMLLMVPGLVEGASGFDYIGRELVYVAKTQYNLNLEVWAMDRRNNCLRIKPGLLPPRRPPM